MRRRSRATRAKARAAGVRSGFEQRVCEDLDARGITYQYEPYPISWSDTSLRNVRCDTCGSVTVSKARTYTPDLRIPGYCRTLFVELKGKFTADDRKTLLGVKRELKTGTELRILFQRNNWISSRKAQRYSKWAERNGFVYAIGERIPDEWVR